VAESTGIFCSLRFKFALALALFSSILMLAVMGLLEQSIRRSLVRESIEKGIGIARGVAFNAEDPLLTGDDLYLFSAVKNAGRSPGIVYAIIVDRQGRIRAAGDMDAVGENFRVAAGAEPVAAEKGYRVLRTVRDDAPVLDLEVPIFSVADNPIRLGEIHLGLSEEPVSREVRNMRYRLSALTLAALIAGSLVAYLLAGLFVRPVHALVRGVKSIGEGNLDQHLDLKRKDELGVLTDAFNEMAASLREKEFIKSTFERYVSKPLAQQILKHRDELQLGGEEKEVTILFSDIRKFTSLAEGLPPSRVVEMLNDYFTRMIEIVGQNEGMVDKLMGDSVMALFGAPIALGNDSFRAVRCALEMQEAVTAFNQERTATGLPPLTMGIGINTGPVVAGNIGSSMRMEYTVIGDNVNVAARLQGIAKPGEILISEATHAQVRDRIVGTPMDPMTLKGKRFPVGVYRIDGLREG
jgi:class 3 adenylate cyclase